MIESLLERAQQLVESGRYNEAEKELRNVLAQDPNSPHALALLAICQAELGKVDEALRIVKDAISKQPDNDYFLYLQALFMVRQENYKEAEKTILNAIAFHPKNADYFGLLGVIKLNQKEWSKALEYADQGLQIDPDNLQCLNCRSTALFKLDKKDQAYVTIKEALNQDPENDTTHANVGWTLLEMGEHKKALEHFREALKIDPSNAYAKAGLVEGLKARYWFYRIFLRYAFWLANMKAKNQWLVIIGLYIGVKLMRYVADNNSSLSVFLTPIIYLYVVFAISTWIIEPLSNLFLRLNVYGRYALTDEETRSSNFVGISLAVGLAGGFMYLLSGNFIYVMVLVFGVSMMIPLASMFNPVKKSKQTILIAYAIGLGLLGLGMIAQYSAAGEVGPLFPVYAIGVVAYGWIANAMIIK